MADFPRVQNARVRRRMQEWISEPGRSQKALAKALQRAIPSINVPLNDPDSGFSYETVRRFAQYARRTLMELVAARMQLVLHAGSAAQRENA